MDENRDDLDWREGLRDRGTWLRGLHMLILLLCLSLALAVLYAVAAIQFASVLFSRRPFEPPLSFARGLSTYIAEIALFLTWSSDVKPWPWAPWPNAEVPPSDDRGHGGSADGEEGSLNSVPQGDGDPDDGDRPEEGYEPPPSDRMDKGSAFYPDATPPRPDA